MKRLGIDMQSVFGLPPREYVDLAADLGCGHLTIGLSSLPWNPLRFPTWSLVDNPHLQRDFIDALGERRIMLSVVAGFSLRAETDVRDMAGQMDVAVLLGAQRISTVGMDRDLSRAHDQLAVLAAMATDRGMGVLFDYAPHHPINTLDSALSAIAHAGSANVQLSLDAMHVFRAGATVTDIAALDPACIGYAQLCDVPAVPPHQDYARETTFERLVPGDGDLPLAAFVAALPHGLPIGVEVPNRDLVIQNGLDRFVARAVSASRRLLEHVEADADTPQRDAFDPIN